MLLRDAAYESLCKSRRETLHLRAAELLRHDFERGVVEPEVIAHHYVGAGLDRLAAEWWGKAGDQAHRRSAFQEAIAHFSMAIAVAEGAGEPSHAGLDNEETWRALLTRMRVAYANALFHVSGPQAQETAQAFAAADTPDGAGAQLATEYGLWAASYMRGNLPSMRRHAATFLHDVKRRPDSPEAGVGHRIVGVTLWVAGKYTEAREHLERALTLFQPGRDDELALRFGHDAGVAAMLCLAMTLWPLGELERAISQVNAALERTEALPDARTRAYARMHAAVFELMRGRFSQVASHASAFTKVIKDYDLGFWRPLAVFFDGWAQSERGCLAEGVEGMRRGLELWRKQNNFSLGGLLTLALGRAEARAGDPGAALATLDLALATSQRAGYRVFDAELHRVRGEILLMHNPAPRAAAEEAFQAAISIASQQNAHNFHLRAALSLAKLHQSAGRPADARRILRPALDGWPPSSDTPEIAEAQGLRSRLAGLGSPAGSSA